MNRPKSWQVCAKPMNENRMCFEEEREGNAQFALCPVCLFILPVAWFAFRYLKRARRDMLAISCPNSAAGDKKRLALLNGSQNRSSLAAEVLERRGAS